MTTRKARRRGGWRLPLAAALALSGAVVGAKPTAAQVLRDGTLGPDASVQPAGPDYVIDPSMGEAAGANLFHSFSEFSFSGPERVRFTGPGFDSILGRVTGGNAANIDGLLGADANRYLMNPAGVVFGPNARLEVDGSFHATTADYVGFVGGERFYADPARIA